MKIVQVKLENMAQEGETLTTWVDVRDGLAEGSIISLKEYPGREWVVSEYYGQEHEAKDFDFHRKWDNNNYDRHKGLGV